MKTTWEMIDRLLNSLSNSHGHHHEWTLPSRKGRALGRALHSVNACARMRSISDRPSSSVTVHCRVATMFTARKKIVKEKGAEPDAFEESVAQVPPPPLLCQQLKQAQRIQRMHNGALKTHLIPLPFPLLTRLSSTSRQTMQS